jgi:hypothetical protein
MEKVYVIFERVYFGLVGESYEDILISVCSDKERAKEILNSSIHYRLLIYRLNEKYNYKDIFKKLK